MADDPFVAAYSRLANLEGGYANDPDDRGGETYAGIARRWHPSWSGWNVIDSLRSASGFPGILKREDIKAQLHPLVVSFYRALYWEPVGGDHLQPRHAAELLDQAVHFGVVPAVEHLQRALNVMNYHGKKWEDISPDGQFGRRTLAAYREMLDYGYDDVLSHALDIYQGARLVRLLEKAPDQESFAINWLRRVFASHATN